MITIRRSTEEGLEAIDKPLTGCWIEVADPSPDEAAKLTRDLNIPREFVTFSLDPDEIPIIEKADNAVLILARIPHFQGRTATVPYVTLPMGFIVSDEKVVTICRSEHELLRDLPHDHQTDLSTANPNRFVLHLLWSAANSYLRHLNEINKVVEELEEGVERSLQNREVLALLRYQKSLLHFTTALRANETMLERLKRSESLKLDPNDEDLLDDVFTETQISVLCSVAKDERRDSKPQAKHHFNNSCPHHLPPLLSVGPTGPDRCCTPLRGLLIYRPVPPRPMQPMPGRLLRVQPVPRTHPTRSVCFAYAATRVSSTR